MYHEKPILDSFELWRDFSWILWQAGLKLDKDGSQKTLVGSQVFLKVSAQPNVCKKKNWTETGTNRDRVPWSDNCNLMTDFKYNANDSITPNIWTDTVLL